MKQKNIFFRPSRECTCVWELIEGKPPIRHIHVSNPIGEMKVAEGDFREPDGKNGEEISFKTPS